MTEERALVFPGVKESDFDFDAPWDVVEIDSEKLTISYAGTGKNKGLGFTHDYENAPEEFARLKQRYDDQLAKDVERIRKDAANGVISSTAAEGYITNLVPFEFFTPDFFIDYEDLPEEDMNHEWWRNASNWTTATSL